MQIDLFSGYVPYISIDIKGVQMFIPFRHTMEFFTKSENHHMWSFEDMDEDEFTPELRKINEWDFIIALDRNYQHGTMITCMNETIHGNRFSIHSKKNYHVPNTIDLNISMNIGEDGPNIFENVQESILELQSLFPERFTTKQNVEIRPEGRVSMYTMNCIKYTVQE